MKTIIFSGMLLLALTYSASAQKIEIKPDKSVITWTGNKIGGSHYGGIKVQSGYFEFKDGDIVDGNVIMDMNTISDFDLKDEAYNKKLVDHLKSDDFFGVVKYPTSTFKVTKASKFGNGKATLTGVLTIKDKSETIFFDVTKKGNVYSTQLKVDRSKFDVRYGSKSFFDDLGDKVIDDVFILDIQFAL